ncbi:hypothetical protein GGI00_003137 [Coemansia sp. RSA 2681]|nr:hypothetical protein GGI00_003137 [Coemansia sp. RSA 2681]
MPQPPVGSAAAPPPEDDGYTELTEVRVDPSAAVPDDTPVVANAGDGGGGGGGGRGQSQMALTPILEVVTPRSSIFVKSPDLST